MMEHTQMNNSISEETFRELELPADMNPCLESDLICLSHLRWDFVFQRPQHLLTRFAKHRRVFFVEEPIFDDSSEPRLEVSHRENGLRVATPHLPSGTDAMMAIEIQRMLIDEMIHCQRIWDYTLWYYTPMALSFTRHLEPARVIYDCMDELSLFKGAPQALIDLESELFARADLVFTGGHSLFEHKQMRHENIHASPSSIDFAHFSSARNGLPDPVDQMLLPHPRVGFFGVIDERADLEMIEGIADLRPNWQIVMIGPVVKIDEATLPKRPNIHYLGMKSYAELPAYLSNWDLAILPFAINESTRFISPTKTPEYLAAGKPVVSTPVRDVVRPYGEEGLVQIAATPPEFVVAGDLAMRQAQIDSDWRRRVDAFLGKTSWDGTWAKMAGLESRLELETRTIPEIVHSNLAAAQQSLVN
jgi:glycosyltransferase involved in cell wall biosynthesis